MSIDPHAKQEETPELESIQIKLSNFHLDRIYAALGTSRQTLENLQLELSRVADIDYKDHIRPIVGTVFILEAVEELLDELYGAAIPADLALKVTRQAATSEKKALSKKK